MSANPQPVVEPQSVAEALENLQHQIAGQLPADMHSRLSLAVDELIRSKPAASAVRVGQRAPEFTLQSIEGNTLTLSKQLLAGPVVLTFYRGSWCPFCDLTLRAYSKRVPELRRAGAQLIAISPQRANAAVPNAAEHRRLNFPLLSDPGNHVAREYGLVYSVGAMMRSVLGDFGLDLSVINGAATAELPVPATFLVKADGTIGWAYVEADYRRRAEPDHILQAIAEP